MLEVVSGKAHNLEVGGSNPSSATKQCPGGGIGRHAGLRSQCESVTVRVRPGAPINNESKMIIERKSSRHTVDTDKCVTNMDNNRFNLVIAAAQRARELKRGSRKLTSGSDGNIITALKEIEEGLIGPEILKKIK